MNETFETISMLLNKMNETVRKLQAEGFCTNKTIQIDSYKKFTSLKTDQVLLHWLTEPERK